MHKDHIFVPINAGGDTNSTAVHHKKSCRRVSLQKNPIAIYNYIYTRFTRFTDCESRLMGFLREK